MVNVAGPAADAGRHHEVDLRRGHVHQRRHARRARRIRHRQRDSSQRLGGGCVVAASVVDARFVPKIDAIDSGVTAAIRRCRRLHRDRRNHAVIARHPVRQNVVDAGRLDDPAASAGKLIRVLLPQIFVRGPQSYRNRLGTPSRRRPQPRRSDSPYCLGSAFAAIGRAAPPPPRPSQRWVRLTPGRSGRTSRSDRRPWRLAARCTRPGKSISPTLDSSRIRL